MDTSVPDDGPEEVERKPFEYIPPDKRDVPPKDEWDLWAEITQDRIDKLISESRTMKLAVLAIGAVSLAALGAAVMTSKAVTGMMQALNQLGQNQVEIAQAIGIVDKVAENEWVQTQTIQDGKFVDIDASKVEDIKSVDFDPDAVVGIPYEGPATEASEDAKAQLARDKAAGIIDAAKGDEL